MSKTLIIGASNMAKAYAKVLIDLDVPFDAICRSSSSAKSFKEYTGVFCHHGGVTNLLGSPHNYTKAIVAVGVEVLQPVTIKLIQNKIKEILIEKPAGLNTEEIQSLQEVAEGHQAQVYIAYNRRQYAAVLKAKEIIESDGGALSGNFEFTEWSHKIEPLEKAPGVKENWFLANSTHVVDLAFYLMGKPKEISCQTSGKLSWHTPAIFTGSGITENNVLFNYNANWISAGRWGVEVLTRKRKLILSPMEELQEQLVGTIAVQKVEGIDYSKDDEFKPGIWLQTKYFIEDRFEFLKPLSEQVLDLDCYEMMLGVVNE